MRYLGRAAFIILTFAAMPPARQHAQQPQNTARPSPAPFDARQDASRGGEEKPAAVLGRRRAVRHPSPPAGPAAQADSYNTGFGTPLNTPAPGVLVNDTLNQGAITSYGVSWMRSRASS